MKNLITALILMSSYPIFANECLFSVEDVSLFPKSIMALETLGYVQDSTHKSSLVLAYNSSIMVYGGLFDDHDLDIFTCFGTKKDEEIECLAGAQSYRWAPFPQKEKTQNRRIISVVKSTDRKLAKRIRKDLKPCE